MPFQRSRQQSLTARLLVPTRAQDDGAAADQPVGRAGFGFAPRERARWIACSVAFGVLGCVVLSGCGAGGSKLGSYGSAGNTGTFAGYVLPVSVKSIQATWSVPEISSASPPGRAGTWIGAQSGSGPASAFIQVGTNEEASDSSGLPAQNYYAFWSDTTLGFSPVFLFDVRPGDVIVAMLQLRDGSWQVSITDRRSRVRRRFTTQDESTARFTSAEWLQEDIAQQVNGQPFPYPQIVGSVRFFALRVNDRAPSPAAMLSQWMSNRTAYLAPTRLHADAFKVIPTSISAAGVQYLRIALPTDAAENLLGQAFSAIHANTPIRRSRPIYDRLADILKSSDTQMTSEQWPTAAAGRIRDLVHVHNLVIALLEQGPGTTPHSFAAFERRFSSLRQADVKLAYATRRALGVPQVIPIG